MGGGWGSSLAPVVACIKTSHPHSTCGTLARSVVNSGIAFLSELFSMTWLGFALRSVSLSRAQLHCTSSPPGSNCTIYSLDFLATDRRAPPFTRSFWSGSSKGNALSTRITLRPVGGTLREWGNYCLEAVTSRGSCTRERRCRKPRHATSRQISSPTEPKQKTRLPCYGRDCL